MRDDNDSIDATEATTGGAVGGRSAHRLRHRRGVNAALVDVADVDRRAHEQRQVDQTHNDTLLAVLLVLGFVATFVAAAVNLVLAIRLLAGGTRD